MKIYVMGTSRAGNIDTLTAAAYRKATRNMKLAASAVESLLDEKTRQLPVSLVVGSSYGELETTREFLSTLKETKVARPFLFQSSLHNATTGFMTLLFQIRGPSFTVSDRYFSGETALDTALTVLESGQVPLAIAVTVDTVVSQLAAHYAAVYPPRTKLTEGAAAILLATEEGVKLLGRQPKAVVNGVEINRRSAAAFDETNYYDSNALELFGARLSEKSAGEMKLTKPDGGTSLIRWSQA